MRNKVIAAAITLISMTYLTACKPTAVAGCEKKDEQLVEISNTQDETITDSLGLVDDSEIPLPETLEEEY